MSTTQVMDGMMENCTRHSCGRAETIMTRCSESWVRQRDHCASQTLAGDGLQRPLRSRFQPHLKRGVDMTSNVKSSEQTFF